MQIKYISILAKLKLYYLNLQKKTIHLDLKLKLNRETKLNKANATLSKIRHFVDSIKIILFLLGLNTEL